MENVSEEKLRPEERAWLLKLARLGLEEAVCGVKPAPLDLENIPERLRAPGATFVTLTRKGELRGCIGSLEPRLPLAEDVREHAASAAIEDYRFEPVRPEELPEIEIEISYLNRPKRFEYECPEDLVSGLRPGIDGVVLRDGFRQATFLPQVWEKLTDPESFLGHLCMKMGAPADYWRQKKLQVYTYQVEEFKNG